jgi:ADP-heptose:LPS heptosyltransferase
LVSELTGQAPDWELRPKVLLTPSDEAEAEAYFQTIHPDSSIPLVACFVTTRQPTGVWPIEKFRETLELLHSSAPVHIILCGAPGDVAQLNDLQFSLSFPTTVNAGRLGLRSLVAFLRKCRAVLSTDSGPRHLANAAGVPVVYFRNLRSAKIETGNYLTTEYDLAPDTEFIFPPAQSSYFMQTSAKQVHDLILEFLS